MLSVLQNGGDSGDIYISAFDKTCWSWCWWKILQIYCIHQKFDKQFFFNEFTVKKSRRSAQRSGTNCAVNSDNSWMPSQKIWCISEEKLGHNNSVLKLLKREPPTKKLLLNILMASNHILCLVDNVFAFRGPKHP